MTAQQCKRARRKARIDFRYGKLHRRTEARTARAAKRQAEARVQLSGKGAI